MATLVSESDVKMFRHFRGHSRSLMMAASLFLIGCQTHPSEQVVATSEMTADPHRYLAQHFAADSIADQPKSSIEAIDHEPIPFKTLKLELHTHVQNLKGKANAFDATSEITTESIGGPFVRSLEIVKINGITARFLFSSSYRGFSYLRVQKFDADSKFSQPGDLVTESQKMISSPSVYAKGEPFEITLSVRNPLLNSKAVLIVRTATKRCEPFGSSYPASQVNPAFAGNAQDFSCIDINNLEPEPSRAIQTYLENLGIFQVKRVETSDYITSITISHADITK